MSATDGIREASAKDLDDALRTLEHAWRHDAGARQRYRLVAAAVQPLVNARRRSRYVFLPDVGDWWHVGPEQEPKAYRDDAHRRGLALAHLAIAKRGELAGIGELQACAPGGMKQTALCNALRNAREWIERVTGCAAVTQAVAAVKTCKGGLAYRPEHATVEIVTSA